MPAEPTETVLERNLGAIGVRSPQVAAQVRGAAARGDVGFEVAPDGGVAGWIAEGSGLRQLCSRRGPLAEGRRLAESVDVAGSAAVVVRGMGVGHHVVALARRMKKSGVVIVFEPDVGLLRAVLERVDVSEAARESHLIVLTEAEDTGAMGAAVRGVEALLASGTVIVDHPPSRARLGERAERFAAEFGNVMRAVRTGVVTTLMHVDVTLRNLVQNLAFYACCSGVEDLAGSCVGRAAVVVSAGPSLKRNIEVLARPGVRDRVVIIAVQTVLKQLLARGIRPHFVTALDYHEISRRFYEGLTAADVAGVTLVAEPKANPAILRAFPGAVRCPSDKVLDQVLGAGLARDRGTLTPGATVAHLGYYLARHLGCDPVVLVGQDLGFTDGQYYSAGAAIHQVWGPELGEFRTLEMLEWERIARMPSLLRRTTDQLGRPVYTDEQMATYLVQFERDFLADSLKGLTTIDATEGGVLKKHTRVMTLAAALAQHGAARGPMPEFSAGCGGVDAGALGPTRRRLEEVRASVFRVGQCSRRAAVVLGEMLERRGDHVRVNGLIAEVNRIGAEATREQGYWLVQHVNQTGQLNRFRADRALELDGALPALERQKKEIERDLTNVRWLADAADAVGGILDRGLEVLGGAPPVTRDPSPQEDGAVRVVGGGKVWAVVTADHERGGLGTARDVGAPWADGPGLLRRTLGALARAERVAGVVVLSTDVEASKRAAGVVGGGTGAGAVEFEAADAAALRGRGAAVAAARRWSRGSWRGGIAGLTSADEVLHPGEVARVLGKRGLEACAVLGADWALVQPSLVDAVIERHLESPTRHPVAFTQAPPGLAPLVIARRGVEELARATGMTSTIGALLGYVPAAAQADPIAKPVCVGIDAGVRDCLWRCIPDTAWLRRHLAAAAGAGSAAEVVRALEGATPGVEHVRMRLEAWADPIEVEEALARAVEGADAPGLTLWAPGGVSAALVAGIVERAGKLGYSGVHLRVGLEGLGAGVVLSAPAFGLDVVSVEVGADSARGLRAVAGREDIEAVRTRVWEMFEKARGAGGLPRPWIVPRLTRRDEVYEDVESFYGRWLMAVGAAVIDALPGAAAGARIEPLPLPLGVAARLARTRVDVLVGSPAEVVGA